MVSSRFLMRLAAQAVVAAGAALSMLAWQRGLPANALVAGLAALAAAAWMVTRDDRAGGPDPEPEADTIRLDQERERRTLQAFLDQAPTPLILLQPDGALSVVNRAARRLFRTDSVFADPNGALHQAILET